MSNYRFVICLGLVALSQFAAPFGSLADPALMRFEDVVEKIDLTRDPVNIVFKRHSAVYTILKKNAQFGQIIKALQESHREHSRVVVESDPREGMRIRNAWLKNAHE